MTILAIQTAVFQRLDAELSVPVYDHVPQPNDSGDNALFPYVVIGDDDLSAWDTDTSQGFDGDLTIHVWSRQKGRAETKALQQQIYDALHRFDLSVSGADTITLDQSLATTMMDPDGITRHGVQRFRLLIDNV